MKKINPSYAAQVRRERALARFTVDKKRAAQDPEYAQRKEAELTALRARVGTE